MWQEHQSKTPIFFSFRSEDRRKKIECSESYKMPYAMYISTTLTTVSAHEFNNSNSVFHTFNLHMCSINSPLSFFNSSIKTKRFVYDLKQIMQNCAAKLKWRNPSSFNVMSKIEQIIVKKVRRKARWKHQFAISA